MSSYPTRACWTAQKKKRDDPRNDEPTHKHQDFRDGGVPFGVRSAGCQICVRDGAVFDPQRNTNEDKAVVSLRIES